VGFEIGLTEERLTFSLDRYVAFTLEAENWRRGRR